MGDNDIETETTTTPDSHDSVVAKMDDTAIIATHISASKKLAKRKHTITSLLDRENSKCVFAVGDFNYCCTILKLGEGFIYPGNGECKLFKLCISINSECKRNAHTNSEVTHPKFFINQPSIVKHPIQTHLNVQPLGHESSYDYFITNMKTHAWSLYYLDFSGEYYNQLGMNLNQKNRTKRSSDHVPILVIGTPKTSTV